MRWLRTGGQLAFWPAWIDSGTDSLLALTLRGVVHLGSSRQAGTRTFRRFSGYGAGAAAGSRASMRTGADANIWTGDWAVPWTGAGAGAGAGERAGTWAVAITRTRNGAALTVVEVWAGNGALTGTVLLVAVPGPGRGRGSLVVGQGQTFWNPPGGNLVTAGKAGLGPLQPFIQLPLGSRGTVSLENKQTKKKCVKCHSKLRYYLFITL